MAVNRAQAKWAVARRQREMKQCFDKARKARKPRIQVSDWVRTCLPQHINKMSTFWSQLLQVTHKLGAVTSRLSDGSRWQASRLRKVPALCTSESPPHSTTATSWSEPLSVQPTSDLTPGPQEPELEAKHGYGLALPT